MSLSKISSPKDTNYNFVSPDDYKFVEFEEGIFSRLTKEDRATPDNNVFVLVYEGEFQKSNGDVNWKVETKVFVEDGTAGPWEGSGTGAMLTIIIPDEHREKPLRSYLINGTVYKVIPLSWFSISYNGYNHCSCYGASEACDLTSECDISLREIEQWLTNADLVKSSLSGTFVPEEDFDIISINAACRAAFDKLMIWCVLLEQK